MFLGEKWFVAKIASWVRFIRSGSLVLETLFLAKIPPRLRFFRKGSLGNLAEENNCFSKNHRCLGPPVQVMVTPAKSRRRRDFMVTPGAKIAPQARFLRVFGTFWWFWHHGYAEGNFLIKAPKIWRLRRIFWKIGVGCTVGPSVTTTPDPQGDFYISFYWCFGVRL